MRYLHMDDKEVNIADSETLDALLNGGKQKDAEMINKRAIRKNGA
jgi:hypothetical protein